MPWVRQAVVLTPAATAVDALQARHRRRAASTSSLVDEATLLTAAEQARCRARHGERNSSLRRALLARGPLDDVFLQSDDDYRPLKPVDAVAVRRRTAGSCRYAFYDLAQLAAQREQLRPRPAHQLPGAVLPRRRHPVLRLAHAAGDRQGPRASRPSTSPSSSPAASSSTSGRCRINYGRQLAPERFAEPRTFRTMCWPQLPARVALLAPPRGPDLRELLPRALPSRATCSPASPPPSTRPRPSSRRSPRSTAGTPSTSRPGSCASPRASPTRGRPAPAAGCSSGPPAGPASSTSTPPSRSAPSSPSSPERSRGWSDDRPEHADRHDRRHRDVERRAPAARLPRRGARRGRTGRSSSTTPRPTAPPSCWPATTRRCSVERLPTNTGFAGGVAHALELVTTPYVVLLNNDAVVRPGWLAAPARALRGRPEVGAVCSKLLLPDGRLNSAGGYVEPRRLRPRRRLRRARRRRAGTTPREVGFATGTAVALPDRRGARGRRRRPALLPLLRGRRPVLAAAPRRLEGALPADRRRGAPALGDRRRVLAAAHLPHRAQPARDARHQRHSRYGGTGRSPLPADHLVGGASGSRGPRRSRG